MHIGNGHRFGQNRAIPALGCMLAKPCIGFAADIVAQLLSVVYRNLLSIAAVEALTAQDIHTVLNHIICSGIATCALTVETHAVGHITNQGNQIVIQGNSRLRFSDREQGGYYMTRGQQYLPARPKQPWDTEVPSPCSVALQVLLHLSKEICHPGLRNRTKEQVEYALSVADRYDCGYALAAMMEAK
jgi:hypothetical protein